MAKAEIIPQANELCRISKGTRIAGVMTSSADIRIDGTFEGTVYTIGEAANVKGKIFCQNCDLWGHAEGEMYIEEIINFKASSNFSGDLKAPKLGIEVGAVFNGSCHIITKEEYNKHLNENADLKGAHKPVESVAPQPSKK